MVEESATTITEALALLAAGRQREHEHEASGLELVPLGQLVRRLRRHPEQFCAPELLPAALLDTYSDVCAALSDECRRTGCADAPLPAGCSKSELLAAPSRPARSALPETLDLQRVVRGRNHSTTMRRQLSGGRQRRLHGSADAPFPVAAARPSSARAAGTLATAPRRSASAASVGAESHVRRALNAAGFDGGLQVRASYARG